MKFLEYTPLSSLSMFLNHVRLGEYGFQAVLEAYSCNALIKLVVVFPEIVALCCIISLVKAAGADKKLSRSLEQDVLDSLVMSPQDLGSSPLGPLSSASSRKTLINLILTLNHMYPDYDFSSLRAHHFSKEGKLAHVKGAIETLLADIRKVWENEFGVEPSLEETLWSAIDEVVELVDSEVYSYKPELDEGPFGERGNIWSFNYFFYNKKLKRVLCFSCQCKRILDDDTSPDMYSEEDLYFPNDMDMDE